MKQELNEGILGSSFNLFLAYKFIKKLVTPFDKTKAYKLGIIDKDGKFLKKMNELESPAEKDAYTLMDRFVWNIKKLIGLIPGGSTKLGSIVAGVALLMKEETNKEINTNDLSEVVEMLYKLAITESTNEKMLNTISVAWERSNQDPDEFWMLLSKYNVSKSDLNKNNLYKFVKELIHKKPKYIDESPVMSSGAGGIASLPTSTQGPEGAGAVSAAALQKKRKKKMFKVSVQESVLKEMFVEEKDISVIFAMNQTEIEQLDEQLQIDEANLHNKELFCKDPEFAKKHPDFCHEDDSVRLDAMIKAATGSKKKFLQKLKQVELKPGIVKDKEHEGGKSPIDHLVKQMMRDEKAKKSWLRSKQDPRKARFWDQD